MLSPRRASDALLARARHRARADRPLGPRRRRRALRPGAARRRPASAAGRPVNVLYAGRQTKEKGADLLADAFLAARERDPRLHLLLAGGGPEEDALRERLGEHATFLGWLEGDELAARLRERRPASCSPADRHVRPGAARGAGHRPAGRRGRARAGPSSSIEDGRTGPALPGRRRGARRGRGRPRRPTAARASGSRAAALAAVRARTWDAALGRLADGWQPARSARGRPPRRARSPEAREHYERAAEPRRRPPCARSPAPRCGSSTSRCSTASAAAASAPTSTPRPRTRTQPARSSTTWSCPGRGGRIGRTATSCPRCASPPRTATASRSGRAR